MSFTTIIVGGVALVAGICAGVFFCEKGLVQVDDIREGGQCLMNGTKRVVSKMRITREPVKKS